MHVPKQQHQKPLSVTDIFLQPSETSKRSGVPSFAHLCDTSQLEHGAQFQFSVPVSALDGIVVLGKAHVRSSPSLSSLPKVALGTVPIFVWLNTDRFRPWRVECRPLPFSSPLLFPSGDQCCDALACPCSESSSSLGAPLPCQAADQL